jgi:hypothetical protein
LSASRVRKQAREQRGLGDSFVVPYGVVHYMLGVVPAQVPRVFGVKYQYHLFLALPTEKKSCGPYFSIADLGEGTGIRKAQLDLQD